MSAKDVGRILHLLEKYSADQATAREEQELFRWIAQNEDDGTLESYIGHLSTDENLPKGYGATHTHELLELIKKRIVHQQKPPSPVISRIRFLRRWGWAAACMVFLLAGGAYMLLRPSHADIRPSASRVLPNDVAPGHNGAVLTLDNGQQIVLDSLQNGMIARQHGANVLLNNGEVSYKKTDGEKTSYNTMTTPRGRQYQLVLSDGTKVWLNAESSITYPTVFTGSERKVMVKGEVYFEVTKNKDSPFRVSVNQTTVEVLGTHFNIRAYGGESMTKTTLLKGSVAIYSGAHQSLLTPGEQAQINNSSGDIVLDREADLDAVMAWKNGFFSFHNAGLKVIMREIARWYNVNVVFQGSIPDITFSGDIGRNLSLAQLLSALNEMGVDFRIEGDQLKIIHV